MLLFAETIFSSSVVVTTPTKEIFAASADYAQSYVIIKEATITYVAPLSNVGAIIQDQQSVAYGTVIL